MYAIAASAAGVSVLALSQPSEAKIIYTPKHLPLNFGKTFIDLNHDGFTDLYFDLWTSNADESIQLHVFGFKRKNLIWGSSGWASALSSGVSIGKNSKFKFGDNFMVYANSNTCTTNKSVCGYGPWANVNNRYLGLKFYIKGTVHYGWARLNVLIGGGGRHNQAPGIDATLTGYAYETIPNKPIITGKTKRADAITVEPAKLGHLAAGASAVSGRRKSELVATDQ